MRHAVVLRSIALALLLVPGLAAAQQRIEQQMTPEQFKAAGLDKLSAEELANLNAWLNRTVETESAKAAALAEQKIKNDARGFFNFGSVEPIVSQLEGEFRGFAAGRSYTLANGQVWQQIDGATLSGVRLSAPKVRITPAIVGNTWYLAVDGYNTRARVVRTK
ncbi:MAG TPA: hypothetical protein VEY50_11725 [Lysobacter sp.]|nr:hypothetical protein [Lysobacter sp.]